MGYLNNTTRVLDAILTKKGRELLSVGGNFNITKFALGDDEVDYALWDTTHNRGTDYYGTLIENLPQFEPFNDPSEIMKYKLVTRSAGTKAMTSLISSPSDSQSNLNALTWTQTPSTINRTAVAAHTSINNVGIGTAFGVAHIDNANYGTPDRGTYLTEFYTITVLDSSIAFLGPKPVIDADGKHEIQLAGANLYDGLWLPFVNNVQHISQTISGAQRLPEGLTKQGFANGGLWLFPKQIVPTNSPAKTSIIITGEKSGAVIEFDVTITYGD